MITLDRLVNILGNFGGRLACAPRSRHVELRSVVTHDPTDPRVATGDVFLAVGVESACEAVRLAVETRAAAALIRRTWPVDESALHNAREHGLAVVAVDPAVSWSQLSSVAYGLVLEGRETEAGRGPTDLFALADALAAAVGGPVTVEDGLSRVLAYSSLQQHADRARSQTILGRRVPEEVRAALAEQGVFSHLAVSDDPFFVPPSNEYGLNGRAVVAVRAGGELLGSIWVDCEEPLSPAPLAALEDGARTAALHLLRTRVSADLERQVETDRVIRLLEGDADALAVMAQIGLPPESCRVIALQAHVGGTEHAAALPIFERVTTGFGWARLGRSALFGNTVYTILPCGSAAARARDWVDTVIGADPENVVVHAGIGGAADAAHLPASRQEADESLAVHALRPDGRSAVTYDDSWDEILLARLRTAASLGRVPARGPVVELTRHDREHGTRYVETLRAWLEAQGDLREAAGVLRIHQNTIRYRLRKMSEVAALELDQPHKRLAMLIALAAGMDEQAPVRPE